MVRHILTLATMCAVAGASEFSSESRPGFLRNSVGTPCPVEASGGIPPPVGASGGSPLRIKKAPNFDVDRTLFVGNAGKDTSVEDFRDLFSHFFGPVTRVYKSNGFFAFVEFESLEDARKCLRAYREADGFAFRGMENLDVKAYDVENLTSETTMRGIKMEHYQIVQIGPTIELVGLPPTLRSEEDLKEALENVLVGSPAVYGVKLWEKQQVYGKRKTQGFFLRTGEVDATSAVVTLVDEGAETRLKKLVHPTSSNSTETLGLITLPTKGGETCKVEVRQMQSQIIVQKKEQ